MCDDLPSAAFRHRVTSVVTDITNPVAAGHAFEPSNNGCARQKIDFVHTVVIGGQNVTQGCRKDSGGDLGRGVMCCVPAPRFAIWIFWAAAASLRNSGRGQRGKIAKASAKGQDAHLLDTIAPLNRRELLVITRPELATLHVIAELELLPDCKLLVWLGPQIL